MATGSRVQIDISGLLAVQNKISNAISDGLLAAGEDVRDLAEQFAPKDTTDLSKSGMVEQTSATTVDVSFGNGLPDDRAPAQEFGTVFFPAQPYLTPAALNVDIAFRIKEKLGL